MTGYMSIGRIDQDILLYGLDCLEAGAARLLNYGEGSAFHELTLSCGGALSVWIAPSPGKDALADAFATLVARKSTVLTFCSRMSGTCLDQTENTISYQPKVALTSDKSQVCQ